MPEPRKRSVQHPLPPAHWPDRAAAGRSLLFSPLRLRCGLELRTRTWVPAMVPWRATEEGFVTPEVLDWYERFASGRPGTLVVEATGIRDVRSGPLLRIGHDRFLPGLRRLVETVRRASGGRTRLMIQVIDFLRVNRRPPREKYFRRYLVVKGRHREALARATGSERWLEVPEDEVREGLLALPEGTALEILDEREREALERGYRERVTDTHLEHIRRLPEALPGLFAAAARRARTAGFDGVELHFAHAYTMASFLSPLNTREDGYGGSRENRVRLPLEVIAAARTSVGDDWCIGCRYLTHEGIPGGGTVDDAAWFGVRFAEAGLDYLSLSRGGKFEDARQPKVGEAVYPYTGASGQECMPTARSDARGPFGRNVPDTARVRRAVREAGHTTPVVVAGGIGTFDQAEAVLQRGEADMVGAARQSLADPDWWLKTELGRGGEVRRCTYTNYCEGLDQRHKQVTCKLWDKDWSPEDPVSLSRDGRRRLVAPPWNP